MTLYNLLEAARRDIFGQLEDYKIFTDPETNTDIYVSLSNHLEDDRDNGEARGDHAKPKELRSAIRVGLKKLIQTHGLKTLQSLARDDGKSIDIRFKLKSQKTIFSPEENKKIKVDLYVSVIGVLFIVKGGKNIFKVITIYEPSPDPDKSSSSKFKVFLNS